MLDHAGPERALPVLREGAEHCRDVRPNRLTLRPRRAVPRGVLQVAEQLRVIELVDRVVADPGHGGSVLAVLACVPLEPVRAWCGGTPRASPRQAARAVRDVVADVHSLL